MCLCVVYALGIHSCHQDKTNPLEMCISVLNSIDNYRENEYRKETRLLKENEQVVTSINS